MGDGVGKRLQMKETMRKLKTMAMTEMTRRRKKVPTSVIRNKVISSFLGTMKTSPVLPRLLNNRRRLGPKLAAAAAAAAAAAVVE